MRVLLVTAISALALPFVAFGQEQQQPQGQSQGQPGESARDTTTTTAPAGGKKTTTAAEQQATPATKTETGRHEQHGQTNAQPGTRTEETHKDAAAGAREGASRESNVRAGGEGHGKVNVQEFRSRHSEVFNLGVHPKDFFVQRYGENHFRLIGGGYFVFVDGCWVSVHVDGFGYSERVICDGDPDYVVAD